MFLTVNGYADAAVAVNQGGGDLGYCFAVAQALQRRRLIDEVFFERCGRNVPADSQKSAQYGRCGSPPIRERQRHRNTRVHARAGG